MLFDDERRRWSELDPALVEPLDTLRTFVLNGGKRLRPAFCHWGFVGAGGDPADPAVVDAGAAFELLQAFALIHDDVMDGSAVRRGARTAHLAYGDRHADAAWRGEVRRFGEGVAILLGDLAHVYADRLVPRRSPDVQAVWDELRTELNVGQYLDLVGTARGDVDLAAARRIARYKSGKYTIERPLHVGAALAGRFADLARPALGLRRPARRGLPAPRRPARRVRRRGPHRQAGRRRPPRGQAHPAARHRRRGRRPRQQAQVLTARRRARPLPRGRSPRCSRSCGPPARWPRSRRRSSELTDRGARRARGRRRRHRPRPAPSSPPWPASSPGATRSGSAVLDGGEQGEGVGHRAGRSRRARRPRRRATAAGSRR